jgi:hypothetical protein
MYQRGNFDNSKEGTCPKCNIPMGSGLLKSSTPVYFCDGCRVSVPAITRPIQGQPK